MTRLAGTTTAPRDGVDSTPPDPPYPADPKHLERPARRLVQATMRMLDVPADRSALRRALGRDPAHPMAQGAHRVVAPHLAWLEPFEQVGGPVTRRQIDAVERAFYLVAGLIAAQSRGARDGSLAMLSASTPPASASDASVTVEPAPTGTEPLTGADTAAGGDAASETGTDSKSVVAPPARRRRRDLGRCLADAVNTEPPPSKDQLYRRLEAQLRLVCRQDLDGIHRHLPRLVRYLRGGGVDLDWIQLTVDLARWGTDADTVARTWLNSFYRTARPALAGAGLTDTDSSSASSTTDDDDSESEMP